MRTYTEFRGALRDSTHRRRPETQRLDARGWGAGMSVFHRGGVSVQDAGNAPEAMAVMAAQDCS